MEKLFRRLTVLVLMVGLITGIANATDLTSGLVGYWPLDGDATDSVGGSEGELVGGADWVDDGRVNGAVKLDGSTGLVQISGFELITDTVTFVAWINGWKQSDWAGIVVSRGTGVTWMGFGPNDTLTYVWNNNSPDTYDWQGGSAIPQNDWAMVAIAIEPDQATSYVYSEADGLNQGVNAIPHIEEIIDNLKFGWDECCGDQRHFNGIIDEVMIYDRALTEDEILKLATSGLTVVSAGKLTTTWGRIKQ